MPCVYVFQEFRGLKFRKTKNMENKKKQKLIETIQLHQQLQL